MADAATHPAIGGLRLVLGGNVFGWTADRNESFAVLDAFFARGGRMVDTAEGYSRWVPGHVGGESEAIIGEWMESRGVRKEMRIATKTGARGTPDALRADKVRNAIAGSLDRLRTDYVDLYYAHFDDNSTPLDEVAATYDAICRAGQARELGGSNYTPERLAAILEAAKRLGARPFTVLQPEYNLVRREQYEGALQDVCLANGVAVLPYYGLASGFLTGKYRSAHDWAGNPRARMLDPLVEAGGFAVLAVVDDIVRETGASHAAVALSWLNAQPGVAAPIASATSVRQVNELADAASFALEEEHLRRLDAALPR